MEKFLSCGIGIVIMVGFLVLLFMYLKAISNPAPNYHNNEIHGQERRYRYPASQEDNGGHLFSEGFYDGLAKPSSTNSYVDPRIEALKGPRAGFPETPFSNRSDHYYPSEQGSQVSSQGPATTSGLSKLVEESYKNTLDVLGDRFQKTVDDAYDRGQRDGYRSGHGAGFRDGTSYGMQRGIPIGRTIGYANGYEKGTNDAADMAEKYGYVQRSEDDIVDGEFNE